MNAKVPAAVDDVADYVIAKCLETDTYLNVLKLHKLLYYIQAWHLAFFEGRRAIDGDFQAWIHGPVNRHLYDRFRADKSMYSRLTKRDMREDFQVESLPPEVISHIDGALEVYASFSDDQLEEMTHKEEPWIEARGSCKPRDRCETVIKDETMRVFYSARIAKA